MFASVRPWMKIAAGVVGTVFLGAIGSGFWQHLGDPLYSTARDGVLNLATLGLTTLKDLIYADVARGFSEAASTRTQEDLAFWFSYVLLGVLTLATLFYRETKRRFQNLTDKSDTAQNELTLEQRAKGVRRSLRHMGLVLPICWMLSILVVVGHLLQAAKETYTAKAISNYQQYVNLVRPFVTDDDVKLLNSQFAQIRTAHDYVMLNDKLKVIAQQHNLVLPQFEPW
jgi:hypothetical protein